MKLFETTFKNGINIKIYEVEYLTHNFEIIVNYGDLTETYKTYSAKEAFKLIGKVQRLEYELEESKLLYYMVMKLNCC